MRQWLRYVGKTDTRVAVVFASTREACRDAVLYLRKEAPDVPVHLYSTVQPGPDTAAACACVTVRSGGAALAWRAERALWPYRVAISVGVWTGEGRQRMVKWAPFLIPPFRVLLMNRHGGFFPGTPSHIMAHGRRALSDAASRMAQAVGEMSHRARDKVQDSARDTWRWSMQQVIGFAAAVLRATGYPHRRWFSLLPRRPAPLPEVEASSGTGIAVFTQATAHWDGAAFERFAQSTEARWILWRERDTQAPAHGELTAVFSDGTAFGASAQQFFRAWKPMLLPTSAFRRLQLGEAAQVLAPVAPAVLVDRRKLLALGVPRCYRPETAWMLIFWRAAAAGWRSFSIGQEQATGEEPDQPILETEFLARLLADRARRHLAPSEPELARGSVAFAPGAVKRAGGGERPKVLVVSPFLPFPLSHGGAVRIYNLCRVLAARVDFTLIALREQDEFVDYVRLKEIFGEVYAVDIDERPSNDAALPGQVRRTQSAPLRALIAEVAHQWKPDVLQIEYTHMAHFRDSAPSVPALLVEHDLTFSLYRQLAEEREAADSRREYERWLAFERAWLAAFDGVWTVSSADRSTAIEEAGRNPELTFVVPNGVDIHRFTPAGRAGGEEILYVGSFRHLPNVLGFENLRREVMPRVWRRLPGARLTVVAGRSYERYWSGTRDPRINLHGFVEDLRPLYGQASAVAVPLGPSAGTNIKVLEAMACGKPVVSTANGCAGLGLRDRTDAVIRDDWDGFAEALCALLTDPQECARLGGNARRTAETRFGWDAIGADAYESYLTLSHRTASAPVLG